MKSLKNVPALAGMVCIFFLGLGARAGECAADAHTAAPQQLRSLFDRTWERELREDPLRASIAGDTRYATLWPDRSLKAIAKRDAEDCTVLDDLRRIDRSRLSQADQLNYDLFEYRYRAQVAGRPFKGYLYNILGRQGLHKLPELTETLPFTSAKDYEDWIARLQALGVYVDQNIALLEIAIREKRTQPRVVLDRVVKPLADIANAPPEASGFYAPFKRMPETISAPEQERLRRAGRDVIEHVVHSSYARLNDFFLKSYLPAGRETVGIWDTVDGDAYYRELAAFHTSTTLTPGEIHEVGLREVTRIRGEMDRIIAGVQFKGSFQEFLTFMRTDPKFYYSTEEDLMQAYRAAAKRIDPELVKLFSRLPRTPYGVRAIPEASAPNAEAGYYNSPSLDGTRAGYFYANLYRPEVRPKYEIEVLTAHEAVPGHHLQIALAMELEALPKFRRQTGGYTAYTEGWGLYSESLGEELGLYQDPYSKFGQLYYEMWRAVRLVVDTGIHNKHWTRAQGIEYFKANTPKSDLDIANEVDRYIAWPGQALAYKIGQLKIRELRREAEGRLGSRFDIRAFHEAVLGSGAVPLDVLEKIVREWEALVEQGTADRRAVGTMH